MTKIHSIHDKTFKTAMADLRVAREFFEMYLPEKVLALIDLDFLKLQPNSYVDENFSSFSSDILFQVIMKDNNIGYLYILVEHQSKVDTLMAFRLWNYMIRIWNELIKQSKTKNKNNIKMLPFIFPLVFYHGKESYTSCRNLRDLIEAPLDLIDTYLYKDFYLIDMHNINDEELRKQNWAGILCFMFKHVYDRDVWPHMEAIISMLNNIKQEDAATIYINLLLKYWMMASDTKKRPKDFIEVMQQGLSMPIKGELMTIAEQLIQEGIEKGMQQGLQEGLEQGIRKGTQLSVCKLISQLLEQKFCTIPKHYQQKIDEANTDTLLKWSTKILHAKTLEDVFEC